MLSSGSTLAGIEGVLRRKPVVVRTTPAGVVRPTRLGVAALTVRSARVKRSKTGPRRENGRFRRHEVKQSVGRPRKEHQRESRVPTRPDSRRCRSAVRPDRAGGSRNAQTGVRCALSLTDYARSGALGGCGGGAGNRHGRGDPDHQLTGAAAERRCLNRGGEASAPLPGRNPEVRRSHRCSHSRPGCSQGFCFGVESRQWGTCAPMSARKSLPWLRTRKCSSSCTITTS